MKDSYVTAPWPAPKATDWFDDNPFECWQGRLFVAAKAGANHAHAVDARIGGLCLHELEEVERVIDQLLTALGSPAVHGRRADEVRVRKQLRVQSEIRQGLLETIAMCTPVRYRLSEDDCYEGLGKFDPLPEPDSDVEDALDLMADEAF